MKLKLNLYANNGYNALVLSGNKVAGLMDGPTFDAIDEFLRTVSENNLSDWDPISTDKGWRPDDGIDDLIATVDESGRLEVWNALAFEQILEGAIPYDPSEKNGATQWPIGNGRAIEQKDGKFSIVAE